jgi:glycosyltransferase involved in cell wall biosynthesis
MRIAFYAPLKHPDHPVPSGDRQMARLLIQGLRVAGHEVELASTLRAFTTEPGSFCEIKERAREEVTRLSAAWTQSVPDLWFCYHPYYKAPDLIGPTLARRFGLPYATAEASYSAKRDRQGWMRAQAAVIEAVNLAAVNVCFTARDADGLARAAPDAVLGRLKPFIDTSAYRADPAYPDAQRIIAVAMMRAGDKLESFRMLADALGRIQDEGWQLIVVGDGPLYAEVRSLFVRFGPRRIEWVGETDPSDVIRHLRNADLYVWPGCGEAYGLAYLEAQAAGLPVVAQKTAGVPEVVRNGETGILIPEGDTQALAEAIRSLLLDHKRRYRMGRAAREFVLRERSLGRASAELDRILSRSLAQ